MMLITADSVEPTADSTLYVTADATQVPLPTRIPLTFFVPEQRNPDGSFTLAIPCTVIGSTRLNY